MGAQRRKPQGRDEPHEAKGQKGRWQQKGKRRTCKVGRHKRKDGDERQRVVEHPLMLEKRQDRCGTDGNDDCWACGEADGHCRPERNPGDEHGEHHGWLLGTGAIAVCGALLTRCVLATKELIPAHHEVKVAGHAVAVLGQRVHPARLALGNLLPYGVWRVY